MPVMRARLGADAGSVTARFSHTGARTVQQCPAGAASCLFFGLQARPVVTDGARSLSPRGRRPTRARLRGFLVDDLESERPTRPGLGIAGERATVSMFHPRQAVLAIAWCSATSCRGAPYGRSPAHLAWRW